MENQVYVKCRLFGKRICIILAYAWLQSTENEHRLQIWNQIRKHVENINTKLYSSLTPRSFSMSYWYHNFEVWFILWDLYIGFIFINNCNTEYRLLERVGTDH